MRDPAHISASILNADFTQLGHEVDRAVAAAVDSIHLDVMDGHFVDNISFGPVVVESLRPRTQLPFHTHLMIERPLQYLDEFLAAGSDLVVCHVEALDDPAAVINAAHGAGRQVGVALNPETAAEAVYPYLTDIQLLLVMTVQPGFGGQPFRTEVLPKVRALRAEIEGRGLSVPIGVDGGVNLETIGPAYRAGAEVMVAGKGLYQAAGDLSPVVVALRSAANATD